MLQLFVCYAVTTLKSLIRLFCQLIYTMSASPVARQATQSQSIPSRTLVINDPSQMPTDYSSTPGGTLYSTTPGGTRIVYERSFIMNLRHSPLAQTPPKNLPHIPAIGLGSSPKKTEKVSPKKAGAGKPPNPPTKKDDKPEHGDEDQFQLEI